MASGAPKKVLTVAMTLGLMASVLSTVPVAPALAQDDDQVVAETAGATVSVGEEAEDLSLVHTRPNYDPRVQRHQRKLPPQQKNPQSQHVHIDDQTNKVGDKVRFDLRKYFRNFNYDIMCVYGLPNGLSFGHDGFVSGRPTTPGSYTVRVLIKSSRYHHVVAQSEFTWNIHPNNAAPTIGAKSVSFKATGQEGTKELVPLNIADDQPIDTLKVKVDNAPQGSRLFNNNSGWFLEVPTTKPYTANGIKVTVVDQYGASASSSFNVSVIQQVVNQAPVVSFIPVAQQATGYAGTKATAVIRATDDGLPNGQLSARPKTQLPAGWEFSGSNGQWTITVPSDKPIPLTGIEVVVSDGELETVVTVGICVWEKPAPQNYAPIGLVQPVVTEVGKPVNTGIFVYDVDTDIKNLKVEVVGDNPAEVTPKRNDDGTWYLHVPAKKATNGAVLTELKVTDNTGLSTTFPAEVTVNKSVPTV